VAVSDPGDLEARLRRLEDEAEIRRLALSYGPGVDSGSAAFAGGLWLEDGVYDWDANGDPWVGGHTVEAMVLGEGHQSLIGAGVAHFAGPLLINIDGDDATGLNYSIIMRREGDRFYVWRTSAVRWDLTRTKGRWRVRRRTNRLLDETGAGRGLFGETLDDLFGEEAR
jgi:hypothetical protein